MNILPQLEKEEISKGYKMKIFITSFSAASLTFILCSVFLLPVYITSSAKLAEINQRKEVNLPSFSEQEQIVKLLSSINQKTELVINADSVSVASRVIELSRAKNDQVTINRISYEDTKKTKNNKPVYKIILSGFAENRESLVSFEKIVEKIDFVKSTSVPVGDFAKDKDISFTMTIDIK